MLIRLMQKTKECSGHEPSESLLRDVQRWLALRTITTPQNSEAALEAKGEAGVKTPTLLAQVLTLGVRFNAARKHASKCEDKMEDVETKSIPELISLVNKLLSECNSILLMLS